MSRGFGKWRVPPYLFFTKNKHSSQLRINGALNWIRSAFEARQNDENRRLPHTEQQDRTPLIYLQPLKGAEMATEKQSIRLTKLSTKGGCAAKWSPGDLRKILLSLSPASVPTPDKRLLLGYETSDDCALWQLSNDTVGVFTVDFFTPVVDDPYEFGRIAAANALSDVFAMGAQPHVALNLLALDSSLGTDVATAILQGGADAVSQAGAFVSGGHTIDDDEPKYGLSVFGTAAANAVVRNAGAQPGDKLYLTKPLGVGIMTAAARIDCIGQEDLRPVIDSMMELNSAGSKAMVAAGAHAATDVTGFGLAGHLHEMLEASNC